jgi:hypothetical protein
VCGQVKDTENATPVVAALLGDFLLRLLVTRAVARNSAQIVVRGLQRRDAWTEMVIADRFADVELVDLDAV